MSKPRPLIFVPLLTSMRFRITVAVVLLSSFLLSASARAQTSTETTEAAPDGLIHVMLTLEGQEIDLGYPPDLSVDDPSYRSLLAGTVGAEVQVGTLTGHRALRLGSIVPTLESDPVSLEQRERDGESAEESPATTSIYDLWLNRRPDGWELSARVDDPSEDAGDMSNASIYVIPLAYRARETNDAPAPQLSASLRPTAAEAGKLSLRWGSHVWSTDFRFDELPPAPPRERVSGRGQERESDTDTTAFARGTTLAERNESLAIFADGAEIRTLFWKGIDVEDEDYGRLADVADGEIVQLIRSPVLRIKTDVDLRFGTTDIPTGNLAPGFAGAYGIWLRRVASGWRFVFNDEADSWGTQYNAEFDAAEFDVSYVRGDGAFRPLALAVVPLGPASGRLVAHWGPHEWTADFTVVRDGVVTP